MADDNDDLLRLAPRSVDIPVGDETLTVLPLTIGLLPAFVRALKGVQFELVGEELAVLSLIEEHGEAIIEATAIATGMPLAWVKARRPDEFLRIATAVMQVNADFFVRRVLPVAIGALKELTATLGVISSPS